MRDDELGWAVFCRRLNSDPELIDRVIHDKPDLRQATGTPPAWWAPPSIDFQATEIMLWYKTDPSGVARCIYSGSIPRRKPSGFTITSANTTACGPASIPPKGTGIDFTKVVRANTDRTDASYASLEPPAPQPHTGRHCTAQVGAGLTVAEATTV